MAKFNIDWAPIATLTPKDGDVAMLYDRWERDPQKRTFVGVFQDRHEREYRDKEGVGQTKVVDAGWFAHGYRKAPTHVAPGLLEALGDPPAGGA